jgi:hypothetical protein
MAIPASFVGAACVWKRIMSIPAQLRWSVYQLNRSDRCMERTIRIPAQLRRSVRGVEYSGKSNPKLRGSGRCIECIMSIPAQLRWSIYQLNRSDRCMERTIRIPAQLRRSVRGVEYSGKSNPKLRRSGRYGNLFFVEKSIQYQLHRSDSFMERTICIPAELRRSGRCEGGWGLP